jgi:hypothetical protein
LIGAFRTTIDEDRARAGFSATQISMEDKKI